MKLLMLFLLVAVSASAQTNLQVVDGESMRSNCIQNRRLICGKIIQVLPDGLVVESGYTNLLRDPLTRSWWASGTVAATFATNLVESGEPGAICVGRIFLTNLPRSRGAKPVRYDYVIIEGYPAGQYAYTSVGTVRRTVRRFSASLAKAVDLNIRDAGKNSVSAAPSK
jgi:hypothetical protein